MESVMAEMGKLDASYDHRSDVTNGSKPSTAAQVQGEPTPIATEHPLPHPATIHWDSEDKATTPAFRVPGAGTAFVADATVIDRFPPFTPATYSQ